MKQMLPFFISESKIRMVTIIETSIAIGLIEISKLTKRIMYDRIKLDENNKRLFLLFLMYDF